MTMLQGLQSAQGSSCAALQPSEGDGMGAGNRMWRFTNGEWVEIQRITLLRWKVERLRKELADAERELAEASV